DHEQVTAIGEDAVDTFTAVESHFRQILWPITRWDSKTATGVSPSNAMLQAPPMISSISFSCSARCTTKPQSRKHSSVIDAIGTCHGLNSANSPRMVTSTSVEKPQFFSSENILMQLPTPLLCISRAAR